MPKFHNINSIKQDTNPFYCFDIVELRHGLRYGQYLPCYFFKNIYKIRIMHLITFLLIIFDTTILFVLSQKSNRKC